MSVPGIPASKTLRCLFQIAEAVRRQEFNTLCALGVDALEATHRSWAAFHGVFYISANPHPQFYCTTEAKMIPRNDGNTGGSRS